MVLTKSDLYPNETMGMENKTVIVTTILVMVERVWPHCFCEVMQLSVNATQILARRSGLLHTYFKATTTTLGAL